MLLRRTSVATEADSHTTEEDSNATEADSHATKAGSHATEVDSNATEADSHATEADSHATEADSHAEVDSNATEVDSNATKGQHDPPAKTIFYNLRSGFSWTRLGRDMLSGGPVQDPHAELKVLVNLYMQSKKRRKKWNYLVSR